MIIKLSLSAHANRDTMPTDFQDPEMLEQHIKEEMECVFNRMDIVDVVWHFVNVEED
tara:strand:- start:673 stop:843 length:171 start_codon:yes stop_codon:yes gene_type:complete